MKNADRTAAPNRSQSPDNPLGVLTKREMFAMYAPECSKLFKLRFEMEKFDDDDIVKKINLGYNSQTECEEWTSELTLLGELEAQKEWRYLYADMMLNDLEK